MKRFSEIRNLISFYGFKKIFLVALAEIYRKVWLEFIRDSYAQVGEDLIIERCFKRGFVGRYLEIGAYHPTRLSNTYRFYKKGWRGIVVEPNPEIKKMFEEVRPHDKFWNIGISDKNQVLNYYQFMIPALNTFSKKDADESVKNGHKISGILKINTKNINSILKGKIDFISIDTEGYDEIILRSLDWKTYRPKVVCVETDKKNKAGEFLEKIGYKLELKTKYNSIYKM